MAAIEQTDCRPVVAHVVYRFDTGGLENGIVNLINHMPIGAYRHVIISLTDVTDFRQRIQIRDVEFFSLYKSSGHGFKIYPKLFRLFRKLRPTIVHTRNLAALESQIPAWFVGVKVRIHGEHGRDIEDLDGSSAKYQLVRRIYRPFVQRYVALSRDLSEYLVSKVGVNRTDVAQIYNGVDIARFYVDESREHVSEIPFADETHWVIGSVGRMQSVKDHPTLVGAFVCAIEMEPALKKFLRLVIIGDGPTKVECLNLLEAAGLAELAWLPGSRTQVPQIMRGFDCFVLPSLAEGISNTILEAMATGLPVIATNVGGNSELVLSGETGVLVAASDVQAMADSIVKMFSDKLAARRMGLAGRARVERDFSLDAMVGKYQALYDDMLRAASGRR